MSQQDLFERILALLHDAALDDVHWSEAARLINEAGQMKSNALAFSDRRHQPGPELFFFRLTRISHTVTAEGFGGSVGAEFLPREQVEQEQAALRPCFRGARVAGTAA